MATIRKVRKRRKSHSDAWLLDARDILGPKRGRLYFRDREAADLRLAELKVQHYATPRGERFRVSRDTTLAEYRARWSVRAESEIAPGTFTNYALYFERHLEPELGKTALRDLSRAMIRDHLARKHQSGLGRNTVRLIRSALSVILSSAVEDGLLLANPCYQLRGTRQRRVDRLNPIERLAKVRPFSVLETSIFLATADRTEPRFAPLFWVMAKAGLRPGEVLALKLTDLDLVDRELFVERSVYRVRVIPKEAGEVPYFAMRVGPTKTGTSRRVDLSPKLGERLERHLATSKAESLKKGWRSEWLFPSTTGTLLDKNNVATAFRRILKAAGLSPRHSPYDLRHTFATTLLAKRTPITYVAKQLGHEKPTTTLLWYAHWLPTTDKSHIDAIDDEPIVHREVAQTGSDFDEFGCTDGCTEEENVTRPEGFEPPTLRSEV